MRAPDAPAARPASASADAAMLASIYATATLVAQTTSAGVKTRDVGRCVRCSRGTPSGMTPLCHRCVGQAAAEVVEYLRGLLAALAPRAPGQDAAPASAPTMDPGTW